MTPSGPRHERQRHSTVCTGGLPWARRGSDGTTCTRSPATHAPWETSAPTVPALQTGKLSSRGLWGVPTLGPQEASELD